LKHLTALIFLVFFTPRLFATSPIVGRDLVAENTPTQSPSFLVNSDSQTFCPVSTGRDIPELRWIERSDWINVKTDIRPKAYGDGKHDDTEAIQAAINLIGPRPGDSKVVYFPPGEYRITSTLQLAKRQGAMLVGHGRTTRLVWDKKWAVACFGVMVHLDSHSSASFGMAQ